MRSHISPLTGKCRYQLLAVSDLISKSGNSSLRLRLPVEKHSAMCLTIHSRELKSVSTKGKVKNESQREVSLEINVMSNALTALKGSCFTFFFHFREFSGGVNWKFKSVACGAASSSGMTPPTPTHRLYSVPVRVNTAPVSWLSSGTPL